MEVADLVHEEDVGDDKWFLKICTEKMDNKTIADEVSVDHL